jgi:ubiquinone/menaquinone biosynthesis C-methylase UbiE
MNSRTTGKCKGRTWYEQVVHHPNEIVTRKYELLLRIGVRKRGAGSLFLIYVVLPNLFSMANKMNAGGSSSSSAELSHPHSHEVFSASRAGHLDTRFRRFIYRPDRLADRYVTPGSCVLDFGCGPGFFTREFARRVGDTGTVIAVDLQEEMLCILREKMEREGLMARIRTHQCAPDTINLPKEFYGTIDAAFAIFVVHEVPDPGKLFREISSLLKPEGLFFYSEPPVIVSGREFQAHLAEAEKAGLRLVEKRFFFVNRAAVLRKVTS